MPFGNTVRQKVVLTFASWAMLSVAANALLARFLLHPTRLAVDYLFRFEQPFEEHFLETTDGARINGLYFFSEKKPAKGVVLYFHGNADDLRRWGAYASDFTQHGYDFFVTDYRSFGKSTGIFSEKNCHTDALLAYRFLINKGFEASDIVLFGRSLGSGVASGLAVEVDAKILLLETPYDNLKSVVEAHAPFLYWKKELPFAFQNDDNLPQLTIPIHIFHGNADGVIPYRCAANLKKYLKPTDSFTTILGGRHKNLNTFEAYQKKLQELLR